MQVPGAVVFDIGHVLLEWNPRYLYRKIFTGANGVVNEAAMEDFLTHVCSPDWNVEQDAGRSIAEATAVLGARHPQHKALIDAYYGRFQEMIPGVIDGTVAILEGLKSIGMPVYALTNFGRETFAQTRRRFGFFDLFDGIVVSGEEKLIKPDPRLYHLLLDRYGLEASRTVFTDDSPANIEGARALGFLVHHFTGPERLRVFLGEKGISLPG